MPQDDIKIKSVFFFFALKPCIYLSVSNYLVVYGPYFIVKDCMSQVSATAHTSHLPPSVFDCVLLLLLLQPPTAFFFFNSQLIQPGRRKKKKWGLKKYFMVPVQTTDGFSLRVCDTAQIGLPSEKCC